MRVDRRRSRSLFRRSSSGRGCLPFLLVIGLLLAGVWVGRDWLYQQINRLIRPAPTEINLTQIQQAFGQGDLDSAIQYGRQLIADNPRDIEALEWLTRSLIYRSYVDYNHENDRQRALTLTETALARLPRDTTVRGLHAYTRQANGYHEEAFSDSLRVINRDSEQIAARLALALSYSSRGIFEAALREAQRGVTIAEENAPHWKADAYRVLAITYSDLGRYAEAATAADTAIGYHRRLIPLHFERALYAMQTGDTDTATAHYFNVIAFDDDNVKARLRLCEVSSTLRERSAAMTYCTDVTERAPGWSDGWYQLGREYFLQGDFDRAMHAFGRCSTLQVAHNVPLEDRRFECWYLQGQAAEVVGACETLRRVYDEFQRMDAQIDIPETWSYPPGGLPGCPESAASGTTIR